MARRAWFGSGVVVALVFLVTLPAVTTRLYAADEFQYFAYLRSLWFDRDLSFDNEYRYFIDSGATRDPGFQATFLDAETVTGRRPNYGTIGSAILWLPFYAIADAGVRLGRAFGSATPADGFARPYVTAVTWASACYGLFALWIAAGVATRLGGRGLAAAVAVGLGTPVIFYMYVAPGMAHATSAFAVAVFVWVWLHVRRHWPVGGVAVLAATGALVAMVREQEVFLAIVPAVDYVWSIVERGPGPRGARLRAGAVRLAVAAAAFTVAYLPQLLSYLVLNGRPGPSPVIGAKMHWTAPFAPAVVFSPAHGWVFWTPLVVLAVAGIVLTIARPGAGGADRRRVATLLLVAVATQVYVSGSVASWTLAGAFGQRRFVGMTICLVIGLAWLLARASPGAVGRTVWLATGVAVWWNLALALQFGAGLMDRQRLELGRNARVTFLELPVQLPGLAYRYLFDRASFYRDGSLR
ncbi:MAG TPA: hypothetical protein VMM93_11905 [Vicinamibacterales bacterium]|nr:hypothetical protein [Vicinamibacterales bacterium]